MNQQQDSSELRTCPWCKTVFVPEHRSRQYCENKPCKGKMAYANRIKKLTKKGKNNLASPPIGRDAPIIQELINATIEPKPAEKIVAIQTNNVDEKSAPVKSAEPQVIIRAAGPQNIIPTMMTN
jgi:ribosomal protein S27AE